MATLNILTVLLFLCATAISVPLERDNSIKDLQQTNKYRLPDNAVPIHYNIKVNPEFPPVNFSFCGETSIDFEIRESTSDIVLHTKDLTINEQSTTLETDSGVILQPREQHYDEETEMLYVRFENPLQPGTYTLNFAYDGLLSNDLYGLYASFYMNEQDDMVWLLVTHFQPTSARRVFPCWDEPALKATYNISIKHFPNYTALSNMPMYAQETDENDGKVWTHFGTTPLMSTNILGIVVADYSYVSNSDETIRVWTRSNAINDAKYFVEIASQVTAELTRYLNSSVRVPKMDHVSVPHYSSRATENWGLIVYHEKALLYNENEHETQEKMSNILTLIHELAHQWFGNLVSPAWWKYFWLSEGMATYFKYYTAHQMFPEWRTMDIFAVEVLQQSAFVVDDGAYVDPLNKDFSSPTEIKYRHPTIVYRKSSAVLRMASHIVSEDVFQAGLLKYIDTHKYGAVTSDDLWKSIQEALDESDVPHENFRVKEVMDTWTEQTGYPLVTVIRNYTTGDITINQETSPTNKDTRRKRWWIPVNFATKSNPDFSSTLPMHWLQPNDESLIIKGIGLNDWIIVNTQETAYHRVHYDPTNWRMIAKYLNSDEYEKIHPVNRAQIIDDAFQMLMKNRLSPVIFMEISNYLFRETDLTPWMCVLNILSDMSLYLNDPEGGEILKPHILGLMENLIKSVGFEEQSDDDDIKKINRPNILTWACRLGHSECKAKAAALLAANLENPEENKISKDLMRWTDCMGVMKANQSTWNTLLNTEREIPSYKLLNKLGCSEDPEIIENYLNLTISKDSPISKTASTDVFTFLSHDIPIIADVEFDFLVKNWERINTNTWHSEWIIMDLISRIRTQDQIDKIRAFLQAKGIAKDFDLSYREETLATIKKGVSKIRSIFKNEYSDLTTETSTITLISDNSLSTDT